ncbi:hypothetical protein [Intestinimonas sp. HCP28S3_D6]
MSELLFVNACVRGERSRTLSLARHFLSEYVKTTRRSPSRSAI